MAQDWWVRGGFQLDYFLLKQLFLNRDGIHCIPEHLENVYKHKEKKKTMSFVIAPPIGSHR